MKAHSFERSVKESVCVCVCGQKHKHEPRQSCGELSEFVSVLGMSMIFTAFNIY